MTVSNTWFWSDLHIDHQNVLKWRPGFQNMEQMVNILEAAYNSRVKKHDTVFFLGDISFTREGFERIRGWPGRKFLILGNHDTERRSLNVGEISNLGAFNDIHSMMNFKEFLLTHAPIHPSSLRDRINIHGHQHSSRVDDPRYYNVCVDLNNFAPVTVEDIRARTHIPKPENEEEDEVVSG